MFHLYPSFRLTEHYRQNSYTSFFFKKTQHNISLHCILTIIHQWNLRNRLRLSVSKFLQEHYFRGLGNVISARPPQQNGVPQGSALSAIFLVVILHAIHKAAVHLSRLHCTLTPSLTTRSTFAGTLRQSDAGSMSL